MTKLSCQSRPFSSTFCPPFHLPGNMRKRFKENDVSVKMSSWLTAAINVLKKQVTKVSLFCYMLNFCVSKNVRLSTFGPTEPKAIANRALNVVKHVLFLSSKGWGRSCQMLTIFYKRLGIRIKKYHRLRIPIWIKWVKRGLCHLIGATKQLCTTSLSHVEQHFHSARTVE